MSSNKIGDIYYFAILPLDNDYKLTIIIFMNTIEFLKALTCANCEVNNKIKADGLYHIGLNFIEINTKHNSKERIEDLYKHELGHAFYYLSSKVFGYSIENDRESEIFARACQFIDFAESENDAKDLIIMGFEIWKKEARTYYNQGLKKDPIDNNKLVKLMKVLITLKTLNPEKYQIKSNNFKKLATHYEL
jgi:hypothetical protein